MTDVDNIPVEGENEIPPENAALDVPLDGDAAFASIMGLVETAEDSKPVSEGAAATDPAPAGDGQQPAPVEGAGAGGAEPAAPAGGDAGEPPVARDAGDFTANWGAALEGLETRLTTELTSNAVNEVRTEFANYISAVEQAPRYLVGKTVPRADGSEGEEVLRDAQDARDWQEEIKKQLGREVSRRIEAARTENSGFMEVLSNSVQLFQSNPDIVPNTKQFDKELADEFAALIEPFETRSAVGKLLGWKVDVKPMLATLRQQLTARRAAAGAAAQPAAAAPTAQQQRAAEQPRNERQQFTTAETPQPQAGIKSQAGQNGDDSDSLDTLFGTLGFAPGTIRF